MTASFSAWVASLEARHLSTLTLSEVSRALRALSSSYVERRARLASKSAFDSSGKRAAYALYYAPLHFVTIVEIVRALEARHPIAAILDLGCGTGAAAAAWATSLERPPRVLGIDTHPWALDEASLTYRAFGLRGSTRQVPAGRLTIPAQVDAVVAGWMLNEVDPGTRDTLRRQLLDRVHHGCHLLIVEPIATRVAPWWDGWSAPFIALGARTDEWRFSNTVDLPDIVRRLGRAAGLNPETLTARSLYLEGANP